MSPFCWCIPLSSAADRKGGWALHVLFQLFTTHDGDQVAFTGVFASIVAIAYTLPTANTMISEISVAAMDRRSIQHRRQMASGILLNRRLTRSVATTTAGTRFSTHRRRQAVIWTAPDWIIHDLRWQPADAA